MNSKIPQGKSRSGAHIALVCILLLGSVYCPAQEYIFKSSKEEYLSALYRQKLVRNQDTLIPLQRLDTLRIATLFRADTLNAVLRNAVDLYTPAAHHQSPDSAGESVNCLIIGIGADHNLTSAQFKALRSGRRIVALLFDRSVYQTLPEIVRADAIVHAFSAGVLDYHVSIQQIFGGIQYGVASAPVSQSRRIGYAPAGLVGMDYRYLGHHIDSMANLAIRKRACPGMQVLVARRGKVVFHKAYGFHTYDSLRPVAPTDIYDLASITKISSVLPLLIQLHGAGIFDLDATIGEYFPDFTRSDKADLRWREVLAHEARLQAWIPYWKNTLRKNGTFKWATFKEKRSRRFPVQVTDSLFLHRHYRKKIYRAIRKSPLNDEPGFVYSGLPFYILPAIISRLTHAPFEEVLQTSVYDKLGSSTMVYNPLRYFPKERIVPTERDTFFRMTLLHGRVHDEGAAMMGGISGNAGLFGTADDLVKLAQLYLNKGKYGGSQILPEASVEEFTRCQFCARGNHRGLVFDKPDPDRTSVSICKAASPQSYGHSGYTGTLVWIDPAKELIYIFLSNRVYPTRTNRKLYTLNIRPAIHQILYDAILD